MESFGASFPKVYADFGFKGWWVSKNLLSELQSRYHFGHCRQDYQLLGLDLSSIVRSPIEFGRKMDMIFAVAIFVVGSAIQAGAVNTAMLFTGESNGTRTWDFSFLTGFRKSYCRIRGGDVGYGHPAVYL
jgi:hypothetical protein